MTRTSTPCRALSIKASATICPKGALAIIKVSNQNWVLPFKNNETEIYTSGYEFFPSLLTEIGKAEHHIHLDTFIIASDPLGQIVANGKTQF